MTKRRHSTQQNQTKRRHVTQQNQTARSGTSKPDETQRHDATQQDLTERHYQTARDSTLPSGTTRQPQDRTQHDEAAKLKKEKNPTMHYTLQLKDFQETYKSLTASVKCECVFATELVGGQPAGEDGVRRFVEHQLELTGEEAEQAVRRILGQEIGDRDVTPTGGELQETLTYGIN